MGSSRHQLGKAPEQPARGWPRCDESFAPKRRLPPATKLASAPTASATTVGVFVRARFVAGVAEGAPEAVGMTPPSTTAASCAAEGGGGESCSAQMICRAARAAGLTMPQALRAASCSSLDSRSGCPRSSAPLRSIGLADEAAAVEPSTSMSACARAGTASSSSPDDAGRTQIWLRTTKGRGTSKNPPEFKPYKPCSIVQLGGRSAGSSTGVGAGLSESTSPSGLKPGLGPPNLMLSP
mmetsp:Transcript_22009/g.61554  ORF Transcript_22009/g.61554 Transcript_22009/m.61554 type:complete len:238 (+) Transcript_22009:1652-2365(+)